MSDNTIALSDVAPERARRENKQIDEQFTELEDEAASLREEKASLEDELQSVRDEKQALENVVAEYRDQRKEELLGDIRETIEGAAVEEDDFDFDFAALADADLDTLQTVQSTVEATVEAAGITGNQQVSNAGSGPDLGAVENNEGGTDAQEAAQKAAESLGMGEAWQKVQSGESLAEPTGISLGDNDSGTSDEELANLLKEAMD